MYLHIRRNYYIYLPQLSAYTQLEWCACSTKDKRNGCASVMKLYQFFNDSPVRRSLFSIKTLAGKKEERERESKTPGARMDYAMGLSGRNPTAEACEYLSVHVSYRVTRGMSEGTNERAMLIEVINISYIHWLSMLCGCASELERRAHCSQTYTTVNSSSLSPDYVL